MTRTKESEANEAAARLWVDLLLNDDNNDEERVVSLTALLDAEHAAGVAEENARVVGILVRRIAQISEVRATLHGTDEEFAEHAMQVLSGELERIMVKP